MPLRDLISLGIISPIILNLVTGQAPTGYCPQPFVNQPCHFPFDSCPPGFGISYDYDNYQQLQCICTRPLTPPEQMARNKCRCRGYIDLCLATRFGHTSYSCGVAVNICPVEDRSEICSGYQQYRKFSYYCDRTPSPVTFEEGRESCTAMALELCYTNGCDLRMTWEDCCKSVKFLCGEGFNNPEVIFRIASSLIT
ncbi:uncharacterized protein LOC118432984 isoform X2 [Folsomia candida]|uniref:uncharacterized protein LOC118432984 isoform X2 n=1 Tax=Folsomia candida TaxID=158441 RepID=UPI0016052579|nr:uncharacterized protein LOC118432984 isoform X2 [Folsomia candida]